MLPHLSSPLRFPLFGAKKNVVIETVKQAESGDGVIVRVFENHNRRSTATLDFARALLRTAECSLLEEEARLLETEGTCLSFSIHPYEIKHSAFC